MEAEWSADGSQLPKIEAHTRAKHKILADYVENWVVTLCGNNIGKSKRITLIDGFAGGGLYRDEENGGFWEGSPIRIIRAVERGLEIVRQDKGKPDYELNAKFIFVDKSQSSINCLKLQIKEAGFESYLNSSDKCEFFCAEFEDIVSHLFDEVKMRKGSSFFFLDPFGYTDVSMDSIRKIISLGTSEILFTFMIDFIRRFLSARETVLKNAIEILEAEEYFLLSDLHQDTSSQQSYLRNEILRLFRFKGTARYVYSFALLPNASLVKYYLVHMASSPSAQRVMKETLWRNNNIDLFFQFSYGIYGMGFRTPDYYDSNLRIFDIVESNERAAIESLNDDLISLIYNNPEGLPFYQLHADTMQTNPATMGHYMKYIDQQREYGEIEVIRNGKITKAKNLDTKDIIIKARQGKLFDLKNLS